MKCQRMKKVFVNIRFVYWNWSGKELGHELQAFSQQNSTKCGVENVFVNNKVCVLKMKWQRTIGQESTHFSQLSLVLKMKCQNSVVCIMLSICNCDNHKVVKMTFIFCSDACVLLLLISLFVRDESL